MTGEPQQLACSGLRLRAIKNIGCVIHQELAQIGQERSY